MVYLAFRGEVETSRIIEDCLGRGVVVAAPLTLRADRRLVPLRLEGRAGELRKGAYGILEPDPARCSPVAPESLDLVVVPGVAFDERGGRLGYGGGYYDRFLRRHAAGAIWAALAFEIQIVLEPLPLDAHDVRMDLIFTESRVLGGGNPATL
jgi:5-formyltetrahydrofolate cyclo-ligase